MNPDKDYEALIRNVGERLIHNYIAGIDVKGGINGPYDDNETNIRNLSHLAIICSIEALKYNKKEYITTLKAIGQRLLTSEESNGLWIMRNKESKDTCNGVIGHAWLMEGLIYIYKVTKEEKYLNKCIEIADRHKFNYKIGLWGCPTDNAIDYTLNHQLWYAATLMELNSFINYDKFHKQSERFFSCLRKNMSVTLNGRIRHNVILHERKIDTVKQIIKNILSDYKELTGKKSMAYKEEGYHIFNLMALSRLYMIDKSQTFFKNKKFLKAMSFIKSKKIIHGLDNNRDDLDVSLDNNINIFEEKKVNIYGYPYNVPGFEMAYIAYIFSEKRIKNVAKICMKKQILNTFELNEKMFGKGCHDKVTVNYRVYEYYRFLEIKNDKNS